MLRSRLLHSGILAALASAGHGSTVLVADGNFPHATVPFPGCPGRIPEHVTRASLVTDVLEAVVPMMAIESATLMDSDGPTPPSQPAIRSRMPPDIPVRTLDRFAFYEATRDPSLALVIATGESRVRANGLLTMG